MRLTTNNDFDINNLKHESILTNNGICVLETLNNNTNRDKNLFPFEDILTNRENVFDTDVLPLDNKGYLLIKENNYEEALEFFRIDHQKNPNNPQYYRIIGYCLDKLKRYQESKNFYNKSIKLEHNYTLANLNEHISNCKIEENNVNLSYVDRGIKSEKSLEIGIFKQNSPRNIQKNLKKEEVIIKNETIAPSKIHINFPESSIDENFNQHIKNLSIKFKNFNIEISNNHEKYIDSNIKSDLLKLHKEINQLVNINKTINFSIVNSENINSEFDIIRANSKNFAKKRISIEERFGKLLELINKNQESNLEKFEYIQKDLNEIKLKVYELDQELEYRLINHKNRILDKFKDKESVYNKVNDYIFGFSITLSNQYVCSQVIETDKVQTNFNTIPISVLSAAATLIPGIGAFCGSTVKMINQIINETKFKQEAKKILNLAKDAVDFSQITGQLLEKIFENEKLKVFIIDSKEEKIKIKFDTLFNKIEAYVNKKINDLKKYMYGDIYDNYAKQLGFIHADLIIKEIIKGKINKNCFTKKSLDFILKNIKKPIDDTGIINQPVNPGCRFCIIY